MRTIIFTFSLFLILQQSGFAYVPINYYVSTSGSDSNNTCEQPANPCKSIKAALDKTQTGSVYRINIANGTYEEENMGITDNSYIHLQGGWDNDFIQQTCRPATTVIKPKSSNNGSFIFTYITQQAADIEISLNCLTLAEDSQGNNIHIAVSLGAPASNKNVILDFDHVRVHGFTNQVLSAEAKNGGKITATLSHSVLENNPAKNGVIWVTAKDAGTMELNIDHLLVTNNGMNTTMLAPIYISSSGSGAVTTSIQNSIIAGNQINGNAALDIHTRNSSSSTFTMVNTTVVNNSRIALALFASNNSHNSVSLQNNILLLHTLSDDAIYLYQNDQSWISLNANYCIVGSPWTSGDTSHISYHSTHEVHGDPRLSSTYHLRKGSAAIDAGICGEWINNGGIFLYNRIAPLDDIDGDKRPGFGQILGCDIGADEYRPFSWPMFLPAIVRPHLNSYTIPTNPHF